jgi:2-polyprenyl-3-methyl-5-hydroxy-6-metoxy-1,4-benzoquinol methylase
MDFNRYAANWDDKGRIERAIALAKLIEEKIPLDARGAALDFGCGTGLIAFELAEAIKTIYCYDSSSEMLKVLSGKITSSGIQNLIVLTEDPAQGAEFDKSFDVIYSSMVFHHVENPAAALRGLIRLLRPGGKFIMLDLNLDDGSFHEAMADFDGRDGFSHAEIREMLSAASLSEIEVETVFHGKRQLQNGWYDYSLFRAVGTAG